MSTKRKTRVKGHYRKNRNGSKTWVSPHLRKLPKKQPKPIKISILHDNKKNWHTTKSHKLAEKLDELPEYNAIYDRQRWDIGEKTSPTETDRRERKIIRDSDVALRIVPPTSKTGKRNVGALREIRKAINAGKPVIEIFERGARDGPNRPVREKNYNKMVQIHLQPGEQLVDGLKRAISELKRKQIL